MEMVIHAVIQRIAQQEGVSEQAVLDEMQKAIDEGYNNPDPAVQAYWAAMPAIESPAPKRQNPTYQRTCRASRPARRTAF